MRDQWIRCELCCFITPALCHSELGTDPEGRPFSPGRHSEGEAFLIVYSVTSRASFDRVEKFWTQIVRIKDSDSVPVVLVGNKVDRVHEREVETRHGEQLAHKLGGGCAFVETSAKTRQNLEEAFFTAARLGEGFFAQVLVLLSLSCTTRTLPVRFRGFDAD